MILPPASLPLDLFSTAVRLRNLALGLLLVPALGAPAAAQSGAPQCAPTKLFQHFTVPGQNGGEIAVANGFAYVSEYTYQYGYGCYIYDVTDPATPVQVGFTRPCKDTPEPAPCGCRATACT